MLQHEAMGIFYRDRWCRSCRRETRHWKEYAPGASSGEGNPFVLLAYGLWALIALMAPWRCATCTGWPELPPDEDDPLWDDELDDQD
jgi:hypothetical protein